MTRCGAMLKATSFVIQTVQNGTFAQMIHAQHLPVHCSGFITVIIVMCMYVHQVQIYRYEGKEGKIGKITTEVSIYIDEHRVEKTHRRQKLFSGIKRQYSLPPQDLGH